MKRSLAALALAAAFAAGPASAANLTPDELTQATSVANGDLLLVYPSGGPMKSVQWSVVKGLMQSALGPVYLQVGNNLSDVASPSSARSNLGLGTAATQNTGTSGANVPLLNGANSWGATQTLVAGGVSAAPLVVPSGSLLTAPQAGAIEWDGANLYATKTTGPTREKVAYADGSNLGSNAVGLGSVAQTGANTVLGNPTSATANVAAMSMPSCSAGTSALIWTTNTGFGCNAISSSTPCTATAGEFQYDNGGAFGCAPVTFVSSSQVQVGPPDAAAPVAMTLGAQSVSTGTSNTAGADLTINGSRGTGTGAGGKIVLKTAAAGGSGTSQNALITALTIDASQGVTVNNGTLTPNTTKGIVGTTAADNAQAGSVGEFVSSNVAVGSAVSLTSVATSNVTSVSLSAGDWDCRGNVLFHGGATTAISTLAGAINTTSATFPTPPGGGADFSINASITTPGGSAGDPGFPVGTVRVNASTTTTVFLLAYSVFSSSTNSAYGFLGCRRVR